MLWLILLCAVIVGTIVRYWKLRHVNRFLKSLNNAFWTMPIVGHTYLLTGSGENRMKTFQAFGKQAYKQGGIIPLSIGHKIYVMISDPIIAEVVLKIALEKDHLMDFLRLITGNGSIFAPVNIWRPRRKILIPTFSPKNLLGFVDVFNRQSMVMVSQLKKVVGKGDFSLWNYMTTYTLDSVCETTLGVKLHAQLNPRQPVLMAFSKAFEMISARICQPWLYSDFVYKMTTLHATLNKNLQVLFKFVSGIVEKTRTNYNQHKDYQNFKDTEGMKTFLDIMIESTGREMTNTELEEETMVMVGAGTDTSAVGASFTAVMLSRHPEVQEKVYKELVEVLGESNRPIDSGDLTRLTYLDAVIKETLRLYPPVPFVARQNDEDILLPTGVTLMKNSGLFVSVYAIHRNPKYWGPDVEEFRPERFMEGEPKHPAAFIPFSYGPRACIGVKYAMMSMKTVLSNLLRNYKVLPASSMMPELGVTPRPLRTKFEIMLKHVGNFEVQLEPRRNCCDG